MTPDDWIKALDTVLGRLRELDARARGAGLIPAESEGRDHWAYVAVGLLAGLVAGVAEDPDPPSIPH